MVLLTIMTHGLQPGFHGRCVNDQGDVLLQHIGCIHEMSAKAQGSRAYENSIHAMMTVVGVEDTSGSD